MAVVQGSNSAHVNQLPLNPPFQDLRINVGVVTLRHAPDHLGWHLVAAAVRRYRTLSPGGRALLHAFLVALFLAAILVRLIVIAEQ